MRQILGIFNEFNRKIWPKGFFRTTAWKQLVRATQEQLPSRFSIVGQAPSDIALLASWLK